MLVRVCALRCAGLLLSSLLLVGCAQFTNFGVRCTEDGRKLTADTLSCPDVPRAATYNADAAATEMGRPWSAKGPWAEGKKLGIALSGGGSKSAPVAVGVLAGLNDLGLLLPSPAGGPDDVAISSVSGGGYAAYHLFSQLSWYGKHGSESPRVTLAEAYRDCLKPPEDGTFDASLEARLRAEGILCDKVNRLARFREPSGRDSQEPRSLAYAEQFKLKCGQDLMQPGECSFGRDATSTVLGTLAIVVSTGVSLPGHHFINSLFDSGLSVSPSRHIYREGIGLTYGSIAVRNQALDKDPATWDPADDMGYYLQCDSEQRNLRLPRLRPKAQGCKFIPLNAQHDEPRRSSSDTPERPPFLLQANALTFEDLQDLRPPRTEGAQRSPFWVIQAAAPEFRSLTGWFLTDAKRDISRDTFEISADWYGSGRYGYMPKHPRHMSVLAAASSAAAFFDANQQAVQGRAKPAVGLLLHGLNLNWGEDIDNYNVSDLRRGIHRTLPFPLYWMDSLVSQMVVTAEGPVVEAQPEEEAKKRSGALRLRRERLRSAFIRLTDGGNSENTGAYALIRRGMKAVVIVDAAEDGNGAFGDLCTLARGLRQKEEDALYLSIPGLDGFDEDCGSHRTYDLFGRWGHDVPVLVGCVSPEKDNPCESALSTRLVIIKPRTEWNHAEVIAIKHSGQVRQCVQAGRLWRVRAAAGEPAPVGQESGASAFMRSVHWGASTSAGRQVEAVDCLTARDEDLAACRQATACEVARFFLDEPRTRVFPWWESFPQNRTVSTTANSGPEIFTASRDLARHQVHAAADIIKSALIDGRSDANGAFMEAVRQQCKSPVHSTAAPVAGSAACRPQMARR